LAIGDDNIDWDYHSELAEKDKPFTSTDAFDYFAEFIKPEMRMLDLGCNVAKFYPAFTKLGVIYEGLDFSTKALEIAQKRYPEVTFHLMKAQEMNFKERFGIIFTNTFLQHTLLKTKEQILPRVWKALKRKGFFVIQEKSDVETITTFTREGWIRFITAFGFKLIRATAVGDPRNGYVFQKVG